MWYKVKKERKRFKSENEREKPKKNEYDDLKKLVSVIKSQKQSKFPTKLWDFLSYIFFSVFIDDSWLKRGKENMQS